MAQHPPAMLSSHHGNLRMFPLGCAGVGVPALLQFILICTQPWAKPESSTQHGVCDLSGLPPAFGSRFPLVSMKMGHPLFCKMLRAPSGSAEGRKKLVWSEWSEGKREKTEKMHPCKSMG